MSRPIKKEFQKIYWEQDVETTNILFIGRIINLSYMMGAFNFYRFEIIIKEKDNTKPIPGYDVILKDCLYPGFRVVKDASEGKKIALSILRMEVIDEMKNK